MGKANAFTRRFIFLLSGLALAGILEVLSLLSIHLPPWFEIPFLGGLIIGVGWPMFRGAFRAVSHWRFATVSVLMSMGTLGALSLGQWEEGAIIATFYALSDTMEAYGLARSQAALKSLVAKSPKTAERKGDTSRVPIENLLVGDTIVVRPGDQVPMDGVVSYGYSAVDESAITGESMPKEKTTGDPVYAGTQNSNGYVEVRVTRTAKESTLAKIIELTFRSAQTKSAAQQYIERFAKYYTPGVLGLAILVWAVPVLILGGPGVPWFRQALSLLVISCPCALIISTPVTVFSALGNATRMGALVKGGRYLEELGRLRVVAFDKTRTLTHGRPEVSKVVCFDGFDEEGILACAAGLEAFSEHPLGTAIVNAAKAKGLAPHRFDSFQSHPGSGVEGNCSVCKEPGHFLGSRRFMEERIALDSIVSSALDRIEEEGETAVLVCESDKPKGIIALTDEVRPESAPAIKALKRQGVLLELLTGDNEASARRVARNLGIDSVRARLLPEDKVREIHRLVDSHRHVGMVGDGVNDAPALAAASVGIALAAIGSDLAVENADVALMSDNLSLVPRLIRLGHRCVSLVRFNIWLALIVKALFVGLAVAGHSSLILAIAADYGVTMVVVLTGLSIYTARV